MITAIVWFIFISKNERLRTRFLVTYVMAWALNGTILASIFSSVGPAFFSEIYPEMTNPFLRLMTYLNTVNDSYPLMTLDAQNMLWRLYQNRELTIASGISAMPSMHVSVSFLIFLIFFRTQYISAKILSAIFVLLIMAGSIHLGWHYAIDGYLSIISTALIWRFSAYTTPASKHQFEPASQAEDFSAYQT